jgi:hypothetical protein
MSKVSDAYRVTERLHASFFGDNTDLSEEEISRSGIVARIGSTSSKTVERIEVVGGIDGRYAKQTLSRDVRGNFHLATTFMQATPDSPLGTGGRLIQHMVQPDSPPEAFKPLADSLFMQVMIGIVVTH